MLMTLVCHVLFMAGHRAIVIVFTLRICCVINFENVPFVIIILSIEVFFNFLFLDVNSEFFKVANDLQDV